jgi:hypothetical protein
MSSNTDISALYREFTDALTEVLAENAVGPARRGRLARARAAVKKHPNYGEHEYFLAVEAAFEHWEAMQNAGRVGPDRVDLVFRPRRYRTNRKKTANGQNVRAYFFFGSLAPTIPNICPESGASLNFGFSDMSWRTVPPRNIGTHGAAVHD